MAGSNKYLSVTLNVKHLNSPIKIYGLADWIEKRDPTLCCIQEIHLMSKDIHRMKGKDRKQWTMQMETKHRQEQLFHV